MTSEMVRVQSTRDAPPAAQRRPAIRLARNLRDRGASGSQWRTSQPEHTRRGHCFTAHLLRNGTDRRPDCCSCQDTPGIAARRVCIRGHAPIAPHQEWAFNARWLPQVLHTSKGPQFPPIREVNSGISTNDRVPLHDSGCYLRRDVERRFQGSARSTSNSIGPGGSINRLAKAVLDALRRHG